MTDSNSSESQLSIFGDASLPADPWPDQQRFPLNEGDRSVGKIVSACYEASSRFTIVTAFTSLEHLLSFFRNRDIGTRQVDIVLGSDPTVSSQVFEKTKPVEEQARDYWLRRGISILTGGGAIRLIDAIEDGHVRFFSLKNLHAKIYAGDGGAVLGSSNFSRLGFHTQREANVRFEPGMPRHVEACQIAESLKEDAHDCSEEIRRLLEDLLMPVQWQEALARAAAEILEGDWVSRYPEIFELLREEKLWPHQEQAVAQGLWIIDTRGSVLIADATGSGKTRVGTHLLYSLLNRLWSKGQQHRSRATVVCPPGVRDNWSYEVHEAPGSAVDIISHGQLSAGNWQHVAQKEVRRSNVLFVDEAHNFLNESSKRSRAISAGAPDYTALLTATPINQGSGDLLRMIELLGLDNLSDEEFVRYRELRKQTSLSTENEEYLRSIVRQCTIRRTKHDLNGWVDRYSDGYTTQDGVTHRYPEHLCRTYPTNETEHDRELARDIAQLADQLRGLLWLRSLNKPVWVHGAKKEREFLKGRIKGASGLVAYQVRSALQSSKAALLELVYGTRFATEHLGLDTDIKTESGNFLSRISELLDKPPSGDNLNIELPTWLGEDLKQTVETERSVLTSIGERAKQLSTRRMEARSKVLRGLADEHPVLLSFGAKPITLYHLAARLRSDEVSHDVLVCDGEMSDAERQAAVDRLGLDKHRASHATDGIENSSPHSAGSVPSHGASEGENSSSGFIALCSDAMSEGLNLQRAAAVVLLDTPSVIRIAEQRVGRIDRMDSPHDSITVWWPDDSPAFQSQKRDLLMERYEVNGRLMGNNIKLPDSISASAPSLFDADGEVHVGGDGASPVGTDAMIKAYKQRQIENANEDRLEDAFQPVRRLVGIGRNEDTPASITTKTSLISRDTYEAFRYAEAVVWSRITIRSSEERWGFFCLRGQENRAPRWVLLERGQEARKPGQLHFEQSKWSVETRLSAIANRLRVLLPETEPVDDLSDPDRWNEIEEELESMIGRVRSNEWELLSNKARHGLDLFRKVLYRYHMDASASSERFQICTFLRKATHPEKKPAINLHALADEWLGIVQPRYVAWKQKRSSLRRRDPVRLKDMSEPLIETPLSTDVLRTVAESVQTEEPIQRRIVAAIIAFPANEK
jgi:superfamily II DNA/RNA helicase